MLSVVADGNAVQTLLGHPYREGAFDRRDGDGVAHQQRDDGKGCAVLDFGQDNQRVDGVRLNRHKFGMPLSDSRDAACGAALRVARAAGEHDGQCDKCSSFHASMVL